MILPQHGQGKKKWIASYITGDNIQILRVFLEETFDNMNEKPKNYLLWLSNFTLKLLN